MKLCLCFQLYLKYIIDKADLVAAMFFKQSNLSESMFRSVTMMLGV